MELKVDSRKCGEKRFLTDQESLRVLLVDFVRAMGFHAFGAPYIRDCAFPSPVGGALSAVVFLGESSITVHTYPEHDAVFIDVFHCKEFDVSKAFCWLVSGFAMDVEQTTTLLLDRGISEAGIPLVTRVNPWFASYPVGV